MKKKRNKREEKRKNKQRKNKQRKKEKKEEEKEMKIKEKKKKVRRKRTGRGGKGEVPPRASGMRSTENWRCLILMIGTPGTVLNLLFNSLSHVPTM